MRRASPGNTKTDEVRDIWRYSNNNSDELDSCDSRPASHGDSNLYNVKYPDVNQCCVYDMGKVLAHYRKKQLGKLSVVNLKPISIAPSTNPTPILNLKQEFTFPPSNFTPNKDDYTQTISPLENRIKTPYPHAELRDFKMTKVILRPQSFPMSISNESIKYGSQKQFDYNAHEKAVSEKINGHAYGDGIDQNLKQIQGNLLILKKESDNSQKTSREAPPKIPVQCVIVKPKKPQTPSYKVKKPVQRPSTKSMLKKELPPHSTSVSNTTTILSTSSSKNKASISKKSSPSDLSQKFDISSIESTELCTVSGNSYIKLSTIVDQLQDFDWEVCIKGLRNFLLIAGGLNWEGELGARFIPIISRKLIDFYKSPRSNLCRTACQVTGEFFLLAKSTKRPEFDEMVDILLCKTADPNKFIQKDANAALDKMVLSIPVQHTVRAVCAKAPNHKNAMVRASCARVLFEICKKAGNDQIVGSNANHQTRKRVLSNLAKLLMDKNMETRRNGEHLCRLLRGHRFFMDYFFKDVENKYKMPLKKIIQHIR